VAKVVQRQHSISVSEVWSLVELEKFNQDILPIPPAAENFSGFKTSKMHNFASVDTGCI